MITNSPFSNLSVFQTAIAMLGYADLMPILIEGGTVSDSITRPSV